MRMRCRKRVLDEMRWTSCLLGVRSIHIYVFWWHWYYHSILIIADIIGVFSLQLTSSGSSFSFLPYSFYLCHPSSVFHSIVCLIVYYVWGISLWFPSLFLRIGTIFLALNRWLLPVAVLDCFWGSFHIWLASLFGNKLVMMFAAFLSSGGDVGLGSATGMRYFSGQLICTSDLTAALSMVFNVSASVVLVSAAMLAAANEASDWVLAMWV